MRVGSIPVLDNSEAYANLVEPDPGAQARASQVIGAARPTAADVPRRGERIEVYWTDMDRWFAGNYMQATAGLDEEGQPARLFRVDYDAVDAWPQLTYFHRSDTTRWRRC